MSNMKNSFTIKIGKTTFVVNVIQSENAHKSLNDTFRELCIHAALESKPSEQPCAAEPKVEGDLHAAY